MSIAKMRRKRSKKSSGNHCTGILFHHVQMSASKVSAGYSCAQCRPDGSTFKSTQICTFSKQVNIRTRWKFSSKRRHPHLMILLLRYCLFQCSKIILRSAFNVQYMSMSFSRSIVKEIWHRPFSAWSRILRSITPSVLVINNLNDSVRLSWFRMIWSIIQCHGLGIQLWVNGSIHWTGYSLFTE